MIRARAHRLVRCRRMSGALMYCGWFCGPSAPPASAAEGGPYAGYSGLRIEPCPARSIGLEELRYAHAPTNRRSLGRLNPAGAALSAAAICDALNSIGSSVGPLVGPLKLLQRMVCLTETTQLVKRRKRNSATCPLTERSAVGAKRRCRPGIPSSFHASRPLRRIAIAAQAIEALQQGVEATGRAARVQIDAADLLDQLLQRLELLQPQQERVVLH